MICWKKKKKQSQQRQKEITSSDRDGHFPVMQSNTKPHQILLYEAYDT